jgi:hypothetical protein
MGEAGRRRWWRAVAATLVGGGAATGGWFGFTRAGDAEPSAPLAQNQEEQTPWVRAAAAEPPPFQTPTDGAVVPASAQMPPAAAAETPPALPAVPPVAPGALPTPPAGPLIPPVSPVVPASQPTAAPQARPADLPALPPMTPPAPAAGGRIPVAPAAPPAPVLPDPVSKVPPKPAAPIDGPAVPAAPVIPQPGSTLPAVPPPAELALPTPPVKLPESAQPPTAPKPDSALPAVGGGVTVKPDNVGGNSGPIVPVAPEVSAPEVVKPPSVPVVPVGPSGPAEPSVAAPKLPALPAVPTVGTPGEPPTRAVDRTKPAEAPREAERPVVPLPTPAPNTLAPTPGESTMISLHHTAAAAVLGGIMLAPASPAPAAAPSAPILPVPATTAVPPQADDKVDSVELSKKLTNIEKQLKEITELLNGRRDKDGFPIETDRGLVAQMKDLSDRLKALENDVAVMKKTQTSLRPSDAIPGATVDPRAAGAKGIVRVVNEYPIQISMVVNGTSYKVAPSKSLDIEVPVGEFTYQLLESGAAPVKSVIREKEPVTLRIK